MTIYLCLPGDRFSGRFLDCYTNLVASILASGHELYVRRKYTSNVYMVRNLILKNTDAGERTEMKVTHNRKALPLEGRPYDYMLWIDSDMWFLPKHFQSLVEYDEPIVSGVAICGEQGRVNCGKIDEDGSPQFYDINELLEVERDEKGLVDVDFCGFSWMVVQKGVFESLSYPWFHPMWVAKNGKRHFPSEDIGWCISAREKGWKIKVDPMVWIGHAKELVLHPAAAIKSELKKELMA